MLDPGVTVGAPAAVLLVSSVAGFPGPLPSRDGEAASPGCDPEREAGELTTRDGVRLYWTRRGSGPDTVVVPGAWMLAPVLKPISDDLTVIFYDMRSRGRSERVTEPDRLGFGLDVRDLEDVRRYFDLERISLVGFSYLGGVVARYAMRHPDRVRRMALMGAIPPRAPASYTRDAPGAAEVLGPERVRRLRALREGRDDIEDPVDRCRTYWRTILPLYAGGPASARRLARELDLGCELPNERPEAFERVLARVTGELQRYDWRPEARSLEVSTLVLHGTSDRVAPVAGAREWVEVLPVAQLVEIESAGHLVWAERPERVRRALARFLSPDDGGSGGAHPGAGGN